jgi:hypothetical protein
VAFVVHEDDARSHEETVMPKWVIGHCAPLVVALVVMAGCRDRRTSSLGSSRNDAASSTSSALVPRVVCAPVQGPTKLFRAERDEAPKGAQVASLDGQTALFVLWEGSHERPEVQPTRPPLPQRSHARRPTRSMKALVGRRNSLARRAATHNHPH